MKRPGKRKAPPASYFKLEIVPPEAESSRDLFHDSAPTIQAALRLMGDHAAAGASSVTVEAPDGSRVARFSVDGV